MKSNQNELLVDEREKKVDIYRNMFFAMNANSDSISKMYTRRVVVDLDSALDLNQMIERKIRMHYHEPAGYVVKITVSFSDKKNIEFSTFSEFEKYKWTEPASIKTIVFKWSFNIVMPQYDLPQNYSVMVKVSDGLRPEEMLKLIVSGNIEDLNSMETSTIPVMARVDYIQQQMGEELLNVISNWFDGLRMVRDSKNTFVLFLKSYRKQVAYFFHYVPIVLLIVTLVELFAMNAEEFSSWASISVNQGLVAVRLFVYGSLVVWCIYKIFEKLSSSLYERLSDYGDSFIFDITKGDKRRQDQIIRNEHKSVSKIFAHVSLSLIFDIICGIITGIILK